MRHISWLALSLVLGGCSSAGRQGSGAAAVDSLFARFNQPGSLGCAVGASRDGKPLLARGYGRSNLEHPGPITPETPFNIGSVGKQFTALAVMLLEQRKRLSLDDDIRTYVPELPAYDAPIRVRDLLFHTSGLRDEGTLETFAARPVATGPDFLRLMARQRGLNFTPGSRHQYSHSDYSMLGLVVERVTREPLGDFLSREIWTPLGMTATRLHDDRGRPVPGRAFAAESTAAGYRVVFPASAVVGGSNVYTTIDDLLRWDRNFHTPVVGTPELLARLTERPRLQSGDVIPYAYGVWLGEYRGLPTVSRGGGGGGFHTQMIRFPVQRAAVFVLCNTPADATALAEAVAGVFLAADLTPMPPDSTAQTVETPPDDTAFAGTYANPEIPWDVIRIVAKDGRIEELLPDAAYPLVKLRNGQYYSEGTFYRFSPAASGRPAHLTLTAKDLRQELDRAPTAPLWRPENSVLRGLTGSYYSEEIDAAWDIGLERDTLVLRRPHGNIPLIPVLPLAFIGNYRTPDGQMFPMGIEFATEAGRPTLRATGLKNFEIVRRLRFDRR